jgi:hypothetical protein
MKEMEECKQLGRNEELQKSEDGRKEGRKEGKKEGRKEPQTIPRRSILRAYVTQSRNFKEKDIMI